MAGWWFFRTPFATQEITTPSSLTFKDVPVPKEPAEPAPAPEPAPIATMEEPLEEKTEPPVVVAQAEVVVFPDAKLEAAVRRAIKKPTGDILKTDLVETVFTRLRAGEAGITDLTGLEYCTDLSELFLYNNQITDISPLAGLTNLRSLKLDVNRISDISAFAGLTNLQSLTLCANQIYDISALANLTSLQRLFLESNPISDISVLVTNAEIGSLNSVHLEGSPLSQDALCNDIPKLKAWGVKVKHDGECIGTGKH